MRYKHKSVIDLFNKNGQVTVTKTARYTQDDGRHLCLVQKSASVCVFGFDLITSSSVEIAVDEREVRYGLSHCNDFLALLDSFVKSELKGSTRFDVAGKFSLIAAVKTKGTQNLLLQKDSQEVYLKPCEVRKLEQCIRSVLSSLARD